MILRGSTQGWTQRTGLEPSPKERGGHAGRAECGFEPGPYLTAGPHYFPSRSSGLGSGVLPTPFPTLFLLGPAEPPSPPPPGGPRGPGPGPTEPASRPNRLPPGPSTQLPEETACEAPAARAPAARGLPDAAPRGLGDGITCLRVGIETQPPHGSPPNRSPPAGL